MEQELKLLKEREVEQKNAASGYETLLKDGIPLNEHFIALKNKFNREKELEEKKLRNTEEDIKHEEAQNRDKRHKIEILKHEFEEISWRFNEYKKKEAGRIDDLESKIANENHTIEILQKEKEFLRKMLHDGVAKPPAEEDKEMKEGEANLVMGILPENQDFL